MTGAQEGQDSQSRENGQRPERAKKTQERAHEKQKPGSQVDGKSPRRGLDVHVQDSRGVRHRPTGAYLPCAASPYLQCDARVQPVENDFSRGNVAFVRDGFAERAQNGQRVRVRSPIGTPHDRGVGDVLTEEGSQVGGHSIPVWPPPWTACSRCQPPERVESKWTRPVRCRRYPGLK